MDSIGTKTILLHPTISLISMIYDLHDSFAGFAKVLDAMDELKDFRARFHLPKVGCIHFWKAH